jgi:hypothetical protein
LLKTIKMLNIWVVIRSVFVVMRSDKPNTVKQ